MPIILQTGWNDVDSDSNSDNTGYSDIDRDIDCDSDNHNDDISYDYKNDSYCYDKMFEIEFS